MKNIWLTFLAAITLSAAYRASAAPVVLLDGSFESPAIAGGSIAGGGDGWTPSTSNGVYIIANGTGLGNTPYGTQYLGLNPGTSDSQTIAGFTAGTTYTLQAKYGDLANGTTPMLAITLSGVVVSTQTFLAPTGGLYGNANIPFSTASLSFTPATSGAITIALMDLSPNGTIGVDNVTLVPEPSSLWMMAAGVAMLGVYYRRAHTKKV